MVGIFDRNSYDPKFPTFLMLIYKASQHLMHPSQIVSPTSGAIKFGSSSRSTALAHLWLEQCHETHEMCRHKYEQFTPTRLVKIEGNKLKLYITPTEGGIVYTTLSHCWGKETPLKLLSTNFSVLQQNIPVYKLSKTFKDAIQIVSVLGHQYIWIDSLCIIQDDQDDWKREAGHMADVYGYSDLNIAATASLHGQKGCIFPRHEGGIQGRPLKVADALGNELQLRCIEADMVLSDIDRAPLSRRAWAFQERLLARRTLHFAQSQIYWECQELLACEKLPYGIQFDSFGALAPLPARNFSVSWSAVVKAYSRAQLTHSSDEAMAMASIAPRFAGAHGYRYVAGIWEQTLISDLCWSTPDGMPATKSVASQGTVFPSWSWLSVHDARIDLYCKLEDMKMEYARVSNIHIVPDTEDTYGNIKEGILTLDVRYLHRAISSTTLMKQNGLLRDVQVTLQDPIPGLLYLSLSHILFDEDFGVETIDCVIMPIAAFDVPPGEKRWRRSLHALVLQQIPETTGRYKRIGKVECNDYWAHVVPCETKQSEGCCMKCAFLALYDEMEDVPPSHMYTETHKYADGKQWYRITLE